MDMFAIRLLLPVSLKSTETMSDGRRSSRKLICEYIIPKDVQVSQTTMIFHPLDDRLIAWNKLFVISCMFALFVDPLLLFSPSIHPPLLRGSQCLGIQENTALFVCVLRTLIDAFYAIHMIFEFHTAYTLRAFGTNKVVTNPGQIARRYKKGLFTIDLLSILPCPQIAIVICVFKRTAIANGTKALLSIVFLQYIPRFLRVYPLIVELQKTTGAFPRSSLAGAVYYLLWYILFSHILGASWYLLAVERHFDCWNKSCSGTKLCDATYLFCGDGRYQGSILSVGIIEGVIKKCSIGSEDPPVTFGIYKETLTYGLFATKNFLSLYLYSLWWGLKNLSTLGQGLQTDIYAAEIIFTISITLSGVLHAAFLIGNMHSYLKSFTTRLEELRIKKREMEQWMHRRLLPQDLRHRIERYNQYRWWETGGMDEETFLQSLPKDIRRDVKRHLCMDMIRKVPIFGQMDDQFLDAFCERLKSSLYTEGAYIVQEGDPVNEMVFITHGVLKSIATNAGRSESILKEGDFCGEELLPWALDPETGSILPTSTRMVQALKEVEAFTMTPEDLKFLARQFKCLHTQQAKHLFRFYSQHWRTWAACCIQRAWRRYSERKRVLNRRRDTCDSLPSLTSTLYAFRFIHALRGGRLQKPPEPDFTSEMD